MIMRKRIGYAMSFAMGLGCAGNLLQENWKFRLNAYRFEV